MQLYAIDLQEQLVSARQALKHTNYYCLECQQIVRLRGGPQRRCHFYHLDPTPFCRQHQKGPVHLQIQSYFRQQLPVGDCHLELPFPSIQRIADVAWLSQKIIFEVQCSPISAEEVLDRNRDYQQEGWSVIWILHDQRYNQVRLSAAEIALRSSPHYFCNVNERGSAMIYDQFDICEKGVRFGRLPPLPIDLSEQPILIPKQGQIYPLVLLNHRATYWNYSFKGDLLRLFFEESSSPYIKQALEKEKPFYYASSVFTWRQLIAKLWQKGITIPYQILFRSILEKMCR